MTPDDRLSGLVERLEKSSGPDRELDCEIASFIHGGEVVWKQANYTMETYPARKYRSEDHIGGFGFAPVESFTSSIDAAMALLPPHCELSEISRNVCWDDGEPEREWCVTVHQEDEDGYARAQHSAPGDTFALAICAAALKSRSPQP